LIRYLLIRTHYRQQLDLRLDAFDEAKVVAMKFVDFLSALDSVSEESSDVPVEDVIVSSRNSFVEAMDDDLNISAAFAVVFDFMTEVHKKISLLSVQQAAQCKAFISEVDSVFGFVDALYDEYRGKLDTFVSDEISVLVSNRDAARVEKNFEEADRIRDELSSKGLVVQDVAGKTVLALKDFL